MSEAMSSSPGGAAAEDATAAASPPARRQVLIVLGAPRSGTTLIATALGAHPRIVMLLEERRGGVFRIIGGKVAAVKLCTPSDIDLDRRWHPFYHLFGRHGWVGRNYGHLMPRSRLSLRQMAARADLKAICLIREPAASLAALRNREDRTERAGRDVLRRTYRIFETLPTLPGVETRIVSFDRLLNDPEDQLRQLCGWLQLPFDAAMLEAPRLNPKYPAAGFRRERAAAADGAPPAGEDGEMRDLRARYEALLARAL